MADFAEYDYLDGNSTYNLTEVDATQANCTLPAIDRFPWDGFSRIQRKNGAVVLHAIIAAYLFGMITIICHKYFVPSVKLISKRLGVSDDIIGATAMAAATSSPELFVSSVATFSSDRDGDVALGTIVGSAAFNVLAVPAACAIFSGGQVIELKIVPVTREVVVYALSVIALIMALADGQLSWFESLLLICLYFLYTTGLCCIGRNSEWCNTKASRSMYDEIDEPYSEKDPLQSTAQESDQTVDAELKLPSDAPGRFVRVCKFIMKPAQLMLSITIPDCQKKHLENFFIVTLIMCIVWLVVTSYVATWMIIVIGDTIGLPDSVVGLTLLAVGTSLPEAISSVIVTRQGKGAMGITNAIGSNTFNILICLGLPWLVKTLMPPVNGTLHEININSLGILYITISLLVALLMFYLCLACFDFHLCKLFGTLALTFYIIFIVMTTLVELNVFFFCVNQPVCGRNE